MKVSVRVDHQAHCPQDGKSALESVNASCRKAKCRPAFYTFHREPVGGDRYKPVKGKRVHDKQTALRAADKLQRDLDEGKLGVGREKNITFSEWLTKFEQQTQNRVNAGDLKPGTLRAYQETFGRARSSIGHVNVRAISAPDLRRFYDDLSDIGVASRIRHLKQLNACLAAAVDDGYAVVNPVPLFKKKLKLKTPKRGKAAFEHDELPRLWTAFDQAELDPVYQYLARTSVETGARLGELVALDWDNLDLAQRTLQVRYTYGLDGLVAPKDGEERTLYLTDHALAVIEEWIGHAGVRESGPLFPDPKSGGRLHIRVAQRAFEKALETAGIPKLHPTLHKPRSFHSLRYTTSVLLQHRGVHPRFIEQLLGHSSLELTMNVYGGWTPEQLAAEAARVPAA